MLHIKPASGMEQYKEGWFLHNSQIDHNKNRNFWLSKFGTTVTMKFVIADLDSSSV
jgi:hypothetical protein